MTKLVEQVSKTISTEHVEAMVKALRAANIPVKQGELGGYFVKIRYKSTGERRTPFAAIKNGADSWLVTHDHNLFA